MYTTLIQAKELQTLAASGQPLMVFDCSFDLMQPDAGAQQYLHSHLPGALYAHLDSTLSAKGDRSAASGGRHPLPSREKLAHWLAEAGFDNAMQAVVYDRQGVNYCGRLWWMLKWAGHDAVAILDGGLQAWQAAGGAVESGPAAARVAGSFALRPPLRRLVDTTDMARNVGRQNVTILDARAAARFKGEIEPLDPVAGHIPGALNRPFTQNLDSHGYFKSGLQLREEFNALLGDRPPGSVIHHCGSGVSALPNLVAMEIAGLGQTGLYAGSWSEWCNTPGLPVAQG